MPKIFFDRYYPYAELVQLLHAFAEEFPDLVTLIPMGTSYEGRVIWVAIVTNSVTGSDSEKPAVYIDGNLHATEVSPSSACLYFIHYLTTHFGSDEMVTQALNNCTYYIAPRVNPDGAEWFLDKPSRRIRSSTRPYPFDEEPLEGLIEADIDNDGRQLWMRIKDSHGPWKQAPEDPRLLVRREPEDIEGDFYWVFPEGELRNYDGSIIKIIRKKQGLDLNRNFPADWQGEATQPGAGPFPASEPEIRNIVKFITEHPNIAVTITFHTWSGVLLRPYSSKPDTTFPGEDLLLYQFIGDKGTALTGYPNCSVFHDFRYQTDKVVTGDSDEWAYDHRGVFAWTVEIWSPQQHVGIKDFHLTDWYRSHPIEDDLKLLAWSDQELDGQGYVDWYPFEHPQLGMIELGGWDHDLCWRNPPPKLLEAELGRFPEWLTWLALITPRLSLCKLEQTPIGGNAYKIDVVVENIGWLPTYVSQKSIEKKIVRGIIFEIQLTPDATLINGEPRFEGPQLEGRAKLHSAPTPWSMWSINMNSRTKYTWVVEAPIGSSVTVTARHDRAGIIRRQITLG